MKKDDISNPFYCFKKNQTIINIFESLKTFNFVDLKIIKK
jgi:hypothetical protein